MRKRAQAATVEDALARNQLDLFRARLVTQEKKTASKRKRAQRGALWWGIIQIGSLAATPIFIGLSNMGAFNSHNLVALILSAVSIFSGGMLAAFTFRERWRGFVRIAGRLHALDLEAAFLSIQPAGTLTEEAVSALRLRFQKVLADGSETWQSTVGANAVLANTSKEHAQVVS